MIAQHKKPFEIFDKWIEEAKANPQIIEPTAMCLSTVAKDGRPSSRMILLKKNDERGFCFFTNLTSRKAEQLKENQNIALCFYWGILGRQVRIEGEVEPVSKEEADDYFASRRRGSQIGAWASKQSQIMQNDEEFQQRINEVEERFKDEEVLRPEFWSGFRCKPTLIEFWEEGEFRLHKRTVYKKQPEGWEVTRIYP